ncbi:probable E3 ubiquitin-protein ligase HIP1 [Arachis stenosperma]|uniref:probable E3 ubiquitin-protein ligase HIP1 n=1 Tax=Arachis stenosperma TaxID=217475 RepID=UPI0025AD12E9|nr:probable E3 ubiquitin-protein ligase HIP1 [Arachis stenosperma]
MCSVCDITGNNNQQGQGNRQNAAQGRMRIFTTPSSTSDTDTGGNNNSTLFFENFSSSAIVSQENRETSIMLPINNNNSATEIIHINDEEPDLESSFLEGNLNSFSSILPTMEQTNQDASNLLTLQRNLRINTANNNNRQDGVSLDLSLHQFGGDGSGSSSTMDVISGGAGGGGGGDGLLTSVLNNTSTRRIMPIKRTAPDYARREFTVGESSSAGGAGGGSVAQPMAAPKRRPTANENAALRISSSSNTCTCTPSPTCALHASANNNLSSSSREQPHETANNNNNPQNVVRVPSSLWPISEVQRALQSDSFQRVGGSNRESNNTRNNYPFSSPAGRGTITVTQNRGNSSSSSLFPGGSPSTRLLESLLQNAGTPSSGSGAGQNNTAGTTVGAVPAVQQLSNVARAWIRRLNAHDEALMRTSQSSTPDITPHRALRASPIAEMYNLPTYFADDSRRLRQEIRNAIDHLRNGGSVRLEELLILDYSIVLNLLDNIEEEEDDVPQQFYEYLGDGQRVTNPDLGLTETEVAICIGREIFQTVGEQPQNIDACGICQEDYVHGEELGRLDCAHRYHLSCIRQWLLIKNRCPICKKMALTIIDLEDDEDDDE